MAVIMYANGIEVLIRTVRREGLIVMIPPLFLAAPWVCFIRYLSRSRAKTTFGKIAGERTMGGLSWTELSEQEANLWDDREELWTPPRLPVSVLRGYRGARSQVS